MLLVMVVSRLLGGEGPALSDNVSCPVISLCTTFVSFGINVVGVGLVINKFTQPKPKILMSQTAVMKQRDGVIVIQARYISAHGHLFTNVTAKMSTYINRSRNCI